MRPLVTGGLLAAAVLFTGCGGGASGPSGPQPNTVEVGYNNTNTYNPDTLQVAVNTTVTWTWSSGTHDVTPEGSPSFTASGNLPASAPHAYQYTFAATGTYNYRCTPHSVSPGTGGMRGTIVVQ